MNDQMLEARAAYLRDGAAVIRNAVSSEWIERLRIAVEQVIARPSESAVEYTATEKSGRYVGDFFVWMRDPTFADFMVRSPLPALARAVMGSQRVRLFYDQLLVKEPQTAEETPWHQDLPYWPVQGEDILSIWVALDPVTIDTGAVQYARGSHLENFLYAPRAFSQDSGFAQLYAGMNLPECPSEDAIRARYEVIAFETQPGDVIVHHPLVLHYSAGNRSTDIRRRAIAVRYLGDDAAWDARPGTFVEKKTISDALLAPLDYRQGDRLGGPNFPLCEPPS